MRSLRLFGFVVLIGGLFVACQDGSVTSPETGDISAGHVTGSEPDQCEVIDFESFAHGDAITEVSLSFLSADDFKASVEQKRYESSGIVTTDDAAAYSTSEYSTASLPNDTHLDTQYDDGDLPAALCDECAPEPDGFGVEVMAIVRDENFSVDGDNTEGGQVIFTITEGGDLGHFEITEFLSVDDDEGELGRRLFVDDALVGQAPGDGPNGDVELVSTDHHTWTSTAVFEFGRKDGEFGWDQGDVDGSGGIDQIEVCLTTLDGGEGCTPGFWRNNTGAWEGSGIETSDLFCDTFDCPADFALANPESGTLQDLTMLEALELKGGDVNALARHAVAALLNAATSVEYDLTMAEVITKVNDALDDPATIETVKDELVELNEQGCPLSADESSSE